MSECVYVHVVSDGLVSAAYVTVVSCGSLCFAAVAQILPLAGLKS